MITYVMFIVSSLKRNPHLLSYLCTTPPTHIRVPSRLVEVIETISHHLSSQLIEESHLRLVYVLNSDPSIRFVFSSRRVLQAVPD